MPRVTTAARTAAPARRGRSSDVVAAIDDLLFDPGRWFAIDRHNRRVPRVVIPTRQAGLGLVGRGQVATIVGRLRPEAVAIDIDLDDWRAVRAMEEVTTWCDQHGLCRLIRPSGAAGHWHILIVHGRLLDGLQAFVHDLRGRLAASAKQIDLRRTLRPLTAPHRLGNTPPPTFAPLTPVETLRRLTLSLPTSRRPNRQPGQFRPDGSDAVLVPRPRSARPLPQPWEQYLSEGVRPTIGGQDHSRSTYEAIATGALLRAGHTADTAWQQIMAAHPDAMDKARSNKRRWLNHVWNRAVVDDNTFTPKVSSDPNIMAATAMARAKLWRLLPGQRSRTSILRVALAVLDRMERVGSLRVPVPERDLVLDTGITDRKTIRTALRQLHAHGIGTLHTDTLEPGARRAHTSFEFSVPAVKGPEIPPPGSHTPLPPVLWHVLPPNAAIFWHHLRTSSSPARPDEILSRTGQTAPGALTSRHQLGDAIDVLRQLGRAGLVRCDEHGAWQTTTPAPNDPGYQAAIAGARQIHQVRYGQIKAERAAYRSRVYSEWGRQRAAAIENDQLRHQAWWDGLGEPERERRRSHAAQEFVKRSPGNQAQDKHRWATLRDANGISEADRHDQWVSSIPDDEYRRRSTERARIFASRPCHEQRTLATDWDAHRREFSVARGYSREAALELEGASSQVHKWLIGHWVGSGFEASGGEEHAEAVVVSVAEATGQSAMEFDQPVHRFSSAIVGAVGVEVGQERGFPAA